MKIYLVVLFLLTGWLNAYSSEIVLSETEEPVEENENVSPWKLAWILNINGAQASYRNWSQGGVNSVTLSSGTRFTAEYRHERFVFNHSTSLKYGKARLNGAQSEYRKTDDEIRIRNQFSRLFDDERFSLIAQLNFETQFDKGYNRDYTEVRSRFFAPAYFIETAGFAFAPAKSIQLNAGLSLRQSIVQDTSLSRFVGLDPGDRFRNEGGLSLGLKVDRDLMTNVRYSGSAETFTNFLRPFSSTTVRVVNDINGRINNYLSVNFQFATIYDDNVDTRLQVKQVLSVGFNYRFI